MRNRLLVVLMSAAVLGALLSVPALAVQSAVVADCNAHGQLTRHYSATQLKTALSTMPADVKEYTDCYDVIQRTLLAQLSGFHDGGGGGGGGGGSGGGSGGSLLPTPLIVLLAALALAGATFGALALRRRHSQ